VIAQRLRSLASSIHGFVAMQLALWKLLHRAAEEIDTDREGSARRIRATPQQNPDCSTRPTGASELIATRSGRLFGECGCAIVRAADASPAALNPAAMLPSRKIIWTWNFAT
jgi:hypothetical protein